MRFPVVQDISYFVEGLVRSTQTVMADPLPSLGRTTAASLYRLARRLADRVDLWTPHVRFARGSLVSVRIADTESYDAWVLTWPPNQPTGLHDHGDSAGAFAVLAGALEERTLSAARGSGPSWAPPSVVPRSLPAGRVRAFGSGHVHDVANVTTSPTVSLHVYAAPGTGPQPC